MEIATKLDDVNNCIPAIFSDGISSYEKIEILENGDEIFSSILDSINSAKSYILIETFVYWNGKIGKKISDSLIKKTKEGVKCYLTLDGFGCKSLNKKFIEHMIESGVNVSIYNPIKISYFFKHLKHQKRTHRKLIVIDGKVAYTGGVGIADDWLGNAESPKSYRDLHFKIRGEVINNFQNLFFKNWSEYPGKLCLDFRFNYHHQKSNFETALIQSTPLLNHDRMKSFFKFIISSAKQEVLIASPYFIPDKQMRSLLIKKSSQGVNIRILVPGKHMDKRIVRYCSRFLWKDLLKANISLYEYNKTFIHSKYIIIDEKFSTIGSSNFDNLSLRVNEELNMFLPCESFSRSLKEVFKKDLLHSTIFTYEKYKRRDFTVKIKDYFSSFLRNIL